MENNSITFTNKNIYFSTIHNVDIGSKLDFKKYMIIMFLIWEKIYFQQYWRKKIYWIGGGFDLVNFSAKSNIVVCEVSQEILKLGRI